MAKVIKVEGLSKAYQLGDFGTGTLSRDLERFWARLRGKEDPFIKLGEVNDRTSSSSKGIVWSLKDLNFYINQGDAVGIIGRNGAGKSTLLKILSRVTAPTVGSVKIKGRIASLLEVGTGFHPELTGRENIYLNGTILGMRKAEIKRRFDEIVAFSGVERYIDTPVKRYSSGMYVRLAFAVAAHLESEILIVDEVLAVGDAEFQKKCIGKMGSVSKGEGRTVLFVSHNMSAVNQLCKSAILLKNGMLGSYGDIEDIVNLYQQDLIRNSSSIYRGKGIIKFASIIFQGPAPTYNSKAELVVEFESVDLIKKVVLGIRIKDLNGTSLISINNRHYTENSIHCHAIDKGRISVVLEKLPLLPGDYIVDLFFGDTNYDIEVIENAFQFNVQTSKINPSNHQISLHENKVFTHDVQWIIS